MPLCPQGLIGRVSPFSMRKIVQLILLLKNGIDAMQVNENSVQITGKQEFL